MSANPTILFAEDSENDRLLIQRGFEQANFPFKLQFVENGVLAVEYLLRKNQFGDRKKYPSPNVLLTDLNMPLMGGFELLAWVRGEPDWQRLPVIVVTGSDQIEDWRRAMDLGANSYVVKELLMRPPPALFEAIVECTKPQTAGIRKAWTRKAQRSLAR